MARKILGIIAGIITAGIVVGLVEGGGHMIFPPPDGTDLKNPENLQKIMHLIPVQAKIAVLIAWFLGSFIGGWLAVFLSKWNMAAWVVALFMLAGSIYSLVTIPHPLWMGITAIVIPFLAAYFAVRLANRVTR